MALTFLELFSFWEGVLADRSSRDTEAADLQVLGLSLYLGEVVVCDQDAAAACQYVAAPRVSRHQG
jgi:hypothetical protein